MSASQLLRRSGKLPLLSVALMSPQEVLLEVTLPPEGSRADASSDCTCPSRMEEPSAAGEAP